VKISSGDTEFGIDLGAYSSRQTLMTGHAVKEAAVDVRRQVLGVLARELKVPLDEMGPLSLKSKDPVDITTTCLVFAKSEVANLIFQGYSKEDIIMGIHRAVARRLVAMAKKVDNKSRDAQQAAEITGLPLLGSVPGIEGPPRPRLAFSRTIAGAS